jgi:hypothetical protein
MAKKIRSAKGELVDFDLLKIKEQISSSPPPQDVRMRQDYIEKRLRRRLKKVPAPAPKIEPSDKGKVEEPKMPGVENLSEEAKLIDEVKEEETKPTTTRQRTRKPPVNKAENKNEE